MNAEITDNNAIPPVGWIYFDAECRFCVAHRRRWGRVFERRGFVWLPLQTPGAARRLGITDSQLRDEMWLQLADGRKFRGVNACSVQMRSVWWLWPLGVMLALPGGNAVAQGLYRWIAKHRYCLGGTCTIHSESHSRWFGPALAVGMGAVLAAAWQGRILRAAWWRLRARLGGEPKRGAEAKPPHAPRPKPRPRHTAFLELP